MQSNAYIDSNLRRFTKHVIDNGQLENSLQLREGFIRTPDVNLLGFTYYVISKLNQETFDNVIRWWVELGEKIPSEGKMVLGE